MKAATVRVLCDEGSEMLQAREQEERVIRVDARDRVCGSGGKLDVHRDGLLHRAFSIFVFDPHGRLLLQRRADGKYHFAGLWSNTCCGHPRPGETTARAAARRLEEEFGFRIPLVEMAQLVYRAHDPASGLIEHEYLHVFRGLFAGQPRPNADEIGAWRWMGIAAIRRSLGRRPGSFTPWFALMMDQVFPEQGEEVPGARASFLGQVQARAYTHS